MFKRGDYYYIIHGDLCCFCTRGSDAKVLMSKSPMGPYTEVGAINTYNEHHLAVQNNGIIKVKDQYIWTADMWNSSKSGLKSHDH